MLKFGTPVTLRSLRDSAGRILVESLKQRLLVDTHIVTPSVINELYSSYRYLNLCQATRLLQLYRPNSEYGLGRRAVLTHQKKKLKRCHCSNWSAKPKSNANRKSNAYYTDTGNIVYAYRRALLFRTMSLLLDHILPPSSKVPLSIVTLRVHPRPDISACVHAHSHHHHRPNTTLRYLNMKMDFDPRLLLDPIWLLSSNVILGVAIHETAHVYQFVWAASRNTVWSRLVFSNNFFAYAYDPREYHAEHWAMLADDVNGSTHHHRSILRDHVKKTFFFFGKRFIEVCFLLLLLQWMHDKYQKTIKANDNRNR